ncbi:relaxase domain-containing protein [Streptomyces olivaceoviridis]|uniref:relaxase domain-containing protein n=1 Tax=Streptomyces olivaceoviridis TaxID=1921 RepID=UPI0036FF6760
MDIRWKGGGKRRTRVKDRLIVAADTLYTLYFLEDMSARLGWAWEPREVASGRRSVMEIAGIDRRLVGRQSARRQQIEDALPVLTAKYEERQGHPTGERAAYALACQAAGQTRPPKCTELLSLTALRKRWRASLGNGELDSPGAGVPLARAVAVATGVGFRGHARVGEIPDHRVQQVRTRRGEIVFCEGVQRQTAGGGQRADLLQGLGRLERSAGGRSPICPDTHSDAGSNQRCDRPPTSTRAGAVRCGAVRCGAVRCGAVR